MGTNYYEELRQKRVNRQIGPPRLTVVNALNATGPSLLDNQVTTTKLFTTSSGLENALSKSFRITVGSGNRYTHQKENRPR
ncbi:hypothetical protein NBRC116597_05010 [Phaeobacter sp. NW0010-22]